MDYKHKYLKYKAKYLELRQFAGDLTESQQKIYNKLNSIDKNFVDNLTNEKYKQIFLILNSKNRNIFMSFSQDEKDIKIF